MKKSILSRFALLGILALFLLAAAPVVAHGATGDKDVTTSVENLLKNYINIDVRTQDGVVTLSGSVKSQNVKDRLVDHIRQIPGVKSVNDLITVQDDASMEGMNPNK